MRMRARAIEVVGVVVFERGARRSEHAHIVSKWRPTMNLAIVILVSFPDPTPTRGKGSGVL